MHSLLGVLFDGLAYGALLFVISVGLSITLGLMGFNNLAHGVFAMAGGYLLVTMMSKAGIGFLPALPIVFCAVAAGSLVLERTLYRSLYKSTPLNQVLLSVGIIFVATAGTNYLWGPGQQPVVIPEWLSGQYDFLGLDLSRYRLFLMAIVALITLALVFGLERTRFGAKIRASVDNQRTAESMGIRVDRVFQLTFALGSGLAGLGERWEWTCSALTRTSPSNTSSTFCLLLWLAVPVRYSAPCWRHCFLVLRISPGNIMCRNSAHLLSMSP